MPIAKYIKEQVLKELENPDLTFATVADRHNIALRTVQSWAKDSNLNRREVRVKTRTTRPDPDWQNRGWNPEWNSDIFRSVGYEGGEPEMHWATVRLAQTEKMRWLLWFERRIVELRQELIADQNDLELLTNKVPAVHWFYTLAALPVLCEWLGNPVSCSEISSKIREYRAWNSSKTERILGNIEEDREKWVKRAAPIFPGANQRIGYRSSVRKSSATLKQAIITAAYELSITTKLGHKDTVEIPRGIIGLNALSERVPMFDMVPPKSPYADWGIWNIFVEIFRREPVRTK